MRIEDLTDENVVDILKDMDILDEVLNEINGIRRESRPNATLLLEHTKDELSHVMSKGLTLRLVSGKGFLDYLDTAKYAGKSFVFYVSFMKRRFRTRKQIPAVPDPSINETFNFELVNEQSAAGGSGPGDLDLLSLSKVASPIELVVILADDATGARELIAFKQVEWRFALVFGSVKINLELLGQNSKTKAPIGIVQV
jgi:hypothetical protein